MGTKTLMNPFCQIEHTSSDGADVTPCVNRAMAECADCGLLICDDCRVECCSEPFCSQCYDYHVTHSCVRKPVQSERQPVPLFRSLTKKG